MKILHTADWHIGKKLHKHDLVKDFDLFISWLSTLIKKEGIDLLVISGDVFDLANPSAEARRQYYRSLMRLRELHCELILTGGNHDSPVMLNAPAEILRELQMHVIGGLPEDLEDLIIPIRNKEGAVEVVIAALPYLREADLRNAGEGQSYEDRLQTIRTGIRHYFSQAAAICRTRYPGIPAMALGHLFAAGAESSASERDIQIGNQAAFNALQFDPYFSYIALGHIHKPQRLNAVAPTFYSGSPLPLSFSEREDQKRVLILDTREGWEPRSVPVPPFRNLLRITGNLENLKLKLTHPGEVRQLESLIEVELREEHYDADKILKLDQLVSGFDLKGFRIVKHRVHFTNRIQGAAEIYRDRQLEDLQPEEVFRELIQKQAYDPTTREAMIAAFHQLLEENSATA